MKSKLNANRCVAGHIADSAQLIQLHSVERRQQHQVRLCPTIERKALPDISRTAYENQVITTRSQPSAFPSALRQKRTLVQAKDVDGEEAGQKKATVHLLAGFQRLC